MKRVISIQLLMLVMIFIACIMILAAMFTDIKAQDNPISVCRNTDYGTIRLEFHNIPHTYFEYGSDVVWGYWAEGVAMYPDEGLILADALIVDTDGYQAGSAILINYSDNWQLIGDAKSASCKSPKTQTSKTDNCPVWSIVGNTSEKICLWDLPRYG